MIWSWSSRCFSWSWLCHDSWHHPNLLRPAWWRTLANQWQSSPIERRQTLRSSTPLTGLESISIKYIDGLENKDDHDDDWQVWSKHWDRVPVGRWLARFCRLSGSAWWLSSLSSSSLSFHDDYYDHHDNHLSQENQLVAQISAWA